MQKVQEYAFWLSTASIGLILCAIPFYAYVSATLLLPPPLLPSPSSLHRFSQYRTAHGIIIVIVSFFGSIFILRESSLPPPTPPLMLCGR
jgi:hypothetical protein